jgi:hypothetical protein
MERKKLKIKKENPKTPEAGGRRIEHEITDSAN